MNILGVMFFSCSLIFSVFTNHMFVLFTYLLFFLPSLFFFNFDTILLMKNIYIFLDSYSILMCILSILILMFCLISSSIECWKFDLKLFSSYIFLLIFLMFFFLTSNLFLFFFFFESSLVPILFMILGWGKNIERIQAGVYLFYYTLFSSLPMLMSIFFFLNYGKSLNFSFLSFPLLSLVYIFFVISFLVKMPMFLVHSWLPKAHVEAPVFGSMILAGIMLKMGGYGIFRFLFFFKFFFTLNLLWIYISIWGSVLSSIICVKQSDMKCLVAFSSVSHMSLVILGLFMLNKISILGCFYMMVAHGFCSSGLFFLVNLVYTRSGTRNMMLNKGLINFFPSLSFWWFMFCVSNMGCPPSLNLIAEIFLIISCLSWSFMFLFFLILYSFLSAVYNMLLFTFINHGMNYSNILFLSYYEIREYYVLLMHLFFIFFSFFKLDLI